MLSVFPDPGGLTPDPRRYPGTNTSSRGSQDYNKAYVRLSHAQRRPHTVAKSEVTASETSQSCEDAWKYRLPKGVVNATQTCFGVSSYTNENMAMATWLKPQIASLTGRAAELACINVVFKPKIVPLISHISPMYRPRNHEFIGLEFEAAIQSLRRLLVRLDFIAREIDEDVVILDIIPYTCTCIDSMLLKRKPATAKPELE